MRYIGRLEHPSIRFLCNSALNVRLLVYETCWVYTDLITQDAFLILHSNLDLMTKSIL